MICLHWRIMQTLQRQWQMVFNSFHSSWLLRFLVPFRTIFKPQSPLFGSTNLSQHCLQVFWLNQPGSVLLEAHRTQWMFRQKPGPARVSKLALCLSAVTFPVFCNSALFPFIFTFPLLLPYILISPITPSLFFSFLCIALCIALLSSSS